MKKIIIILLLSGNVYSQHLTSGVVEYTIEPTESANPATIVDNQNMSDSARKTLIETFSQPAYFILDFNNNESLYKKSEKKMSSDADKSPKLKFTESVGGGSSLFYSNIKEKLLLTQKNTFGELLLISYKFPEWELTNETKKIGNYTCYKAIKKHNNSQSRLDTAWYTPEIPVQFGPALYMGLPGLILEVNVGKLRFIATKIKLNTDSSIAITKPNKGIQITEEEYQIKLKKISKEIGF